MGVPPSLVGGVKLTLACALPGVAVPMSGVPGRPATGVTPIDGGEAGLVPAQLKAVTVKVYAVPLVKPVTTCEVPVLPAFVSTPPGGLDVTV